MLTQQANCTGAQPQDLASNTLHFTPHYRSEINTTGFSCSGAVERVEAWAWQVFCVSMATVFLLLDEGRSDLCPIHYCDVAYHEFHRIICHLRFGYSDSSVDLFHFNQWMWFVAYVIIKLPVVVQLVQAEDVT
jgi:hypothetical protein